MTGRSFSVGQPVLYREVDADRIVDVKPMTVVSDRAELTMLWLPIGTPTKRPVLLDHIPGTPRVWRDDNWVLVDGTWSWAELLIVLRPDDAFATWLRWDHHRTFLGWYVNMQTPAARTPLGFDVRDQQLDVLVEPDRSWTLKDEDELEAAVAQGRYSYEEAAQVRHAAVLVTREIEAARYPFDDSLRSWRPARGLMPPTLTEGWDRRFS
jgi:hypothetical protein